MSCFRPSVLIYPYPLRLIKFASKLHRIATSEKILIAPLDWGLGHATRLVPIVQQQIDAGHEVHLGLSGDAGHWLGQRFPQLTRHELPSYGIVYLPHLSFVSNMRRQAFAIHAIQDKEHKVLGQLQNNIGFDKIISDNRYGLFHPAAESIIITHQIFPKANALTQWFLRSYIHQRLRRFDHVWIPDFENEEQALAGELSHGKLDSAKFSYIGPQSRFTALSSAPIKYKQALLLSCPEPLRSAWEKQLIQALALRKEPVAFITKGAQTKPEYQQLHGCIDLFYGQSDASICALLAQSEHVVCNAGYSTLMDMHALNIQPQVFATPGQTEQEYLMGYLAAKGKVGVAEDFYSYSGFVR
jgi:hypothetical protein